MQAAFDRTEFKLMEYQLGPVRVGENVSVYDMYTTVPRKVTGNYSNLYIRFTMQRYVS